MKAKGLVGTRVDRYQLDRALGAGGFGAVYRARHVHTDAIVALKVLRRQFSSDEAMVSRFLREAKAAAAIGNDAIVRVTDAGLSPEGQAFLAMEYLEGMDLKELSERQAPLPPMRVVMLITQVLEGLSAAHAREIVHRDMKPANVYVLRRVDDRGVERDAVKLLDFGISKMHGDGSGAKLTMTGTAMGTPTYMAPEQFFDASNVDGRADVYSVAAMLYELLSGKLPFDADSYAALIVKVRTETAPPLQQVAPQLPAALAQAVMVGLAKEKEKRWASALEFSAALRAAMGLPAKGATPRAATSPVPATPVPMADPSSRSMMMGQTATPTPGMLRGGTPSVVPSPSLAGEALRGAPTPFVSGAQPAAPAAAPERGRTAVRPAQPPASPGAVATPAWPGPGTPAAPGPAPVASGWVVPGTPVSPDAGTAGWVVPTGQPLAAQPAPASSNKWIIWVLVAIGAMVTLGGCCLFSIILGSSN